MQPRSIETRAPATSANLGAGFDVFSVALDALFDSVYVEVVEGNNIEISVEGVGYTSVPTEPSRNTAGIVATSLLPLSSKKCGLRIRINKGIRPASGLGSSAASAAATALAINELLELNLSKIELIKFAAQGEIASAGVPHADNVSAAILGYFTIVKSYQPLDVIQLSLPTHTEFVIAMPEVTVNTALARSILPKRVKLSDLVQNVGRASTIIAGIALHDVNLMGEGMSDVVIEPTRTQLFPWFADVKKSALKAGAAGFALSGAGPAVLALVNAENKKIEDVTKAMKNAFEKNGLNCQIICTKPGQGARVVKRGKP